MGSFSEDSSEKNKFVIGILGREMRVENMLRKQIP